MKKQFNVKIEEQLLADFKKKCKENNLVMGGKIERMIQRYVKED